MNGNILFDSSVIESVEIDDCCANVIDELDIVNEFIENVVPLNINDFVDSIVTACVIIILEVEANEIEELLTVSEFALNVVPSKVNELDDSTITFPEASNVDVEANEIDELVTVKAFILAVVPSNINPLVVLIIALVEIVIVVPSAKVIIELVCSNVPIVTFTPFEISNFAFEFKINFFISIVPLCIFTVEPEIVNSSIVIVPFVIVTGEFPEIVNFVIFNISTEAVRVEVPANDISFIVAVVAVSVNDEVSFNVIFVFEVNVFPLLVTVDSPPIVNVSISTGVVLSKISDDFDCNSVTLESYEQLFTFNVVEFNVCEVEIVTDVLE